MTSSSRESGLFGRLAARVASIFSFIYRLFFLLSLALGLFIGWMIYSGGPSVNVEDNTALVIAPSGALVESVDADPMQRALEQFAGEPPRQTAVRDVVEALDRAREDERIALAVLKLDELSSAGIAAVDEIAEAAARFRESGKPLHVWASMLTQPQYALAAQADEISLDPFGGAWIEGFSVYPNYFVGLFDKLGVDVEVFRVGQFKSAVEPFIRQDMSEQARRANQLWLDSLWQGWLKRVSRVRESAGEAIPALLGELPDRLEASDGDIASVLKDAGVVDRLETLTEFRERMGETVGMEEEGHGSFRQIHYRSYMRATEAASVDPDKPEIRVVTVQGMIVDGQGEPGTAGGDAIARKLDAARRDDKVRAVVLRIDTPGGSVLASERIRRAVTQLQAEDKPVVASMASQAASGGYWIAMDADTILAYDATITGSIGVFGLWLSASDGLDKLGITTDGVGTTPIAGALRPDRPLDDNMQRVLQSGVEHAYDSFIKGVAEGRDMPTEAVEAIAQGRVWSGEQALERGLIDGLGSLEMATGRAAELAGLEADSYRVGYPPHEIPSLFGSLRFFSGRVLALADSVGLRDWIGAQARARLQAAHPVPALALWPADPRGRYALCDCVLRSAWTPEALMPMAR
ncbi:signal peptide peptidase SppA [Algiphilus aromaticivorans]|uniref:signal peptide peptidase SppA n=1 Tax=Algiphilus aromaticivorans TaxID=382454 RepID=UPI0006932EDC|nr:signal peptide peptidase SppA [Algiphilus aromaticivorans]